MTNEVLLRCLLLGYKFGLPHCLSDCLSELKHRNFIWITTTMINVIEAFIEFPLLKMKYVAVIVRLQGDVKESGYITAY